MSSNTISKTKKLISNQTNLDSSQSQSQNQPSKQSHLWADGSYHKPNEFTFSEHLRNQSVGRSNKPPNQINYNESKRKYQTLIGGTDDNNKQSEQILRQDIRQSSNYQSAEKTKATDFDSDHNNNNLLDQQADVDIESRRQVIKNTLPQPGAVTSAIKDRLLSSQFSRLRQYPHHRQETTTATSITKHIIHKMCTKHDGSRDQIMNSQVVHYEDDGSSDKLRMLRQTKFQKELEIEQLQRQMKKQEERRKIEEEQRRQRTLLAIQEREEKERLQREQIELTERLRHEQERKKIESNIQNIDVQVQVKQQQVDRKLMSEQEIYQQLNQYQTDISKLEEDIRNLIKLRSVKEQDLKKQVHVKVECPCCNTNSTSPPVIQKPISDDIIEHQIIEPIPIRHAYIRQPMHYYPPTESVQVQTNYNEKQVPHTHSAQSQTAQFQRAAQPIKNKVQECSHQQFEIDVNSIEMMFKERLLQLKKRAKEICSYNCEHTRSNCHECHQRLGIKRRPLRYARECDTMIQQLEEFRRWVERTERSLYDGGAGKANSCILHYTTQIQDLICFVEDTKDQIIKENTPKIYNVAMKTFDEYKNVKSQFGSYRKYTKQQYRIKFQSKIPCFEDFKKWTDYILPRYNLIEQPKNNDRVYGSVILWYSCRRDAIKAQKILSGYEVRKHACQGNHKASFCQDMIIDSSDVTDETITEDQTSVHN